MGKPTNLWKPSNKQDLFTNKYTDTHTHRQKGIILTNIHFHSPTHTKPHIHTHTQINTHIKGPPPSAEKRLFV